jgi:hypothetical protein
MNVRCEFIWSAPLTDRPRKFRKTPQLLPLFGRQQRNGLQLWKAVDQRAAMGLRNGNDGCRLVFELTA